MITYPRGKAKHKSDTKIEDIYKWYLKNRTNTDKEIKQSTFTAVLTEYHDHKTNQVIYRNMPFQLPYLGRLEIIKYKPKVKFKEDIIYGLPVNFKKTKELWEQNPEAKAKGKVVFYLNENTDKYIMLWKWRKTANLKNMHSYRLILLRKIKRKVTSALKTTNYNIDFYLK